MVQCVGSRTSDRPYCSRVCCTSAVKNSIKFKEIYPKANISVLYRDMRTFGFKEISYQDARRQGVRFFRYDEDRKPEVKANGAACEDDGDCAAGAVGNGIVDRGVLSTSIGTSGVMFVHSDEVKIDPLGRIHTFCHAVRGKWHMMGVNLSAGGSLQWFRNELCKADVEKARKAKTEVYDILTKEAAAAPVGCQGLFFLPYLSGERTPHADPDARGCFIGLTLAHDRGHMLRAIMEGVTYSMRDSLEIIEGLGVPVKQIRASGGGSRSPLWRQIQADVFGRKVVTINSEEGAAYGVALLAAVGAGAFKNVQEACGATIRVVKETGVQRPAELVHDRAFPLYQQLYRSLKNDFKAIAALEK